MAVKTEKLITTLTDKYVRGLPLDAERYIRRDDRQPGFFVMVGEKTRTYYVQYDVRKNGKRTTVRKKLGRADQVTAQEARLMAANLIADRDRPQQKAHVTLRQAWADYEAYLRLHGRSELTIKGGQDVVNRLLADWLDTPLSYLGENPAEVRDRYMKLVEEKGLATAKNVMATLRAVYNMAAPLHLELRGLDNPVKAVRIKSPEPRRTAMSQAELPAWYERLRALPNPVRQEYHLFTLLSGCRKTALAEAQWAHLDVRRRSLHIPKPKGGTARAYDIPLSRAMLRCLWRARKAGRMLCPGSPWVFPSVATANYSLPKVKSASGHLEVAQEKNGLTTGHALRHTYRTLAHAAGAHPLDAEMLMNHKIAGVEGVYLEPGTPVWPRLLETQERISAFLWRAMTAAR